MYRNEEGCVPIFCSDRELVYAVLTEAMEIWLNTAKSGVFINTLAFYRSAESMGRKRINAPIFIGPESIPYSTPEKDIQNASYAFRVDFENGRIETVK